MRNLYRALAALVLAAGLGLGAAAAQAAPASHHHAVQLRAVHAVVPATSGTIYNNDAGYGALWDDVNSVFKTSHGNSTPLTSGSGGTYYELTAPNGKCMQYDFSAGNVRQAGCNADASEEWAVSTTTVRGLFLIENKYANSLGGCAGNAEALSSTGSGADVNLKCPEGSNGSYSTNQAYTEQLP